MLDLDWATVGILTNAWLSFRLGTVYSLILRVEVFLAIDILAKTVFSEFLQPLETLAFSCLREGL